MHSFCVVRPKKTRSGVYFFACKEFYTKIIAKIFAPIARLTAFERVLWLVSLAVIALSSVFSPEFNVFATLATLIGVTALIFVSRGDVLGQALTVVFAVFYGIVSLSFRYYGEMITYLFMSAPGAVFAVISWMKNPYAEHEVKIVQLKKRELCFLLFLDAAVTVLFYFILKYLDTPNLVFSTISVTTSFAASYLTFRRSPYYALTYALNDIVLVVLWVLACTDNISYLSMVFCFLMFLANDLYGFANWRKMEKSQSAA